MAEFHTGIDIDGDLGEPIYAVADGLVTIAKWYGGYGNFVEILHRHDSGGIKTRYGHNSEVLVKEGDWVKRGQVIAYIGSTGYSTDPHIHFELMINGEFWDAGQYIRNAINNGIKGNDLTIDKENENSDSKDKSKKDSTNPSDSTKTNQNNGKGKQDVP
jgi:murein DD-endopeptidase MepM/ murein hydrolase activator NlpD